MLSGFSTLPLVLLHYTITALVIWRVLLRNNLLPPVRLAWVMVVALLPVLGPVAYLLFGEVRLSRADRRHARDVERRLREAWNPDDAHAAIPPYVEPAFSMGRATSDFPPVGGNTAVLLAEDNSAMDDMIAAIETARDHVHLLFYIWLPDQTGTRVAEAASAAAMRGVQVRVLVDHLGSRRLIRSELWTRMQAAGVVCRIALPIGNPLIETFYTRLDLRNHRKIVVVDNRVTWSGSRNCADMEFAIKPRFAPWIDILMRIEGPVVRQFQAVFLSDWMIHCDEDLGHLLVDAPPPVPQGFVGQVIASGPDQNLSGMSEILAAMLYSAHDRVTITTPYFLPDSALHEAICAAAMRGVATTLIVPERNDSWIVSAASEGLFQTLLASGVSIQLFKGGLLHSKIITVDGAFAMIGSANIDRRSFDLNYECNLLLLSQEVTSMLDARQESYLARARPLTRGEVHAWPVLRRIRNNAVALAAPIL